MIYSMIQRSMGAQGFTIDAEERRRCLEQVALVRVLRGEELEEVECKLLVDVPLREVCVEVRDSSKRRKNSVQDLQMRPGWLHNVLVLLYIERIPASVRLWEFQTSQARTWLGGASDKVCGHCGGAATACVVAVVRCTRAAPSHSHSHSHSITTPPPSAHFSWPTRDHEPPSLVRRTTWVVGSSCLECPTEATFTSRRRFRVVLLHGAR